ncbi:WD40 repeat-like protein [Patellaria atrata CBS 101060]|uniref:WD40 repeat-like protein n=1 Tax=Patellaria atrata CBS 101060 TaxID=1346257 RepID=A0A9P4SE57_9PEZI|nr:WD40 repeat-like protein [Patellaria atrata CBS 101060]
MSTEQIPSSKKRKRATKEKQHIREHALKRAKSSHDQTQPVSDGQNASAEKKALPVEKILPEPIFSEVGKQILEKKEKHAKRKVKSWRISEPIGGRFLNMKPIFTKDEKYIIVATYHSILIYSTATSLLVRSLPCNENDTICSYALSSTNETNLYMGISSGTIYLWDWVERKRLTQWHHNTPLISFIVSEPAAGEDDIIHTLERNGKSKNGTLIKSYIPIKGESIPNRVTLFKTSSNIHYFQVLLGGKIIFATSDDHFVVGTIEKESESATSKDSYRWRVVNATDPITCFDVRISTQLATSTHKKKKLKRSIPIVDLITGGAKGEILVYNNIINSLTGIEQSGQQGNSNVMPRRLHWHREAVGTVRWSLDGNYVISGGMETVLVLWQLDTNQKQMLPHLTAAIDGLTVSPSGSSYAVKLADNSIMVLSTTELMPKAHFSGIQSQFFSEKEGPELRETVNSQIQNQSDPLRIFWRLSSVLNPSNPNQLLIAVSPGQSRLESNSIRTSPFLQTFDISSSHHVSRQALARNNVTNFNIGPDHKRLVDPDVILMRMSYDGQWLATVEEWQPSRSQEDPEEDRLDLEVYLKFWLWNPEKDCWMLETRIDSPHQLSGSSFCTRILDLATSPSDIKFSTIGGDGVVRIWRPKTRYRDGRVVRGGDPKGMITWSCQYSIELEKAVEIVDADLELRSATLPIAGKLAFSGDGSVLAASQDFASSATQTLVTFIDTSVGEVKFTRAGLHASGLAALTFVKQYLVILSEALSVWDTVNDSLTYGFTFQIPPLPPHERERMAHLAGNEAEGTFAVALPVIPVDAEKPTWNLKQAFSKVMVFRPENPEPLFSSRISHVVTSLLPLPSKGYLTVDAAAEIRVLTPKTAVLPFVAQGLTMDLPLESTDAEPSTVEETEAVNGDEGMVEEEVEVESDNGKQVELLTFEDDDKPVVRAQQLTEIFDVGPSFALPPVRELFKAVVGLYGRKSRKKAVGEVRA